MKRFLALSLSTLMVCGALTACGGSKEANAPAPAETTAPADTEKTTETATKETAAGEFTFADLQADYSVLCDTYNKVVDFYNDDAIAADEDVNEALAEAKDLIEQIGELKEDQFTSEAEMLEMDQNFVDILDALGDVVDGMELAEDDEADVDASGEEVTFEDVQEAYAGLVSDYELILGAVESGEVELTEDQVATMDQTADYINAIGEIDESTFETQEDLDDAYGTIFALEGVLVELASTL